MIEVLVTILVMAIGLLGVAAMQTVSMKSTVESSQRTAAISIANDVFDRMRANAEGRLANRYNIALSQASLCSATPAKICADYYDQSSEMQVQSVACSSTEIASFDAWELQCGYDNEDDAFSSPVDFLVNPVIAVSCTDSDTTDADACSIGSTNTVTVTWSSAATDKDRGGVAETHSVTLSTSI